MYDELICKLRNNAEFLEIASLHQTPADGFAATMREAADAIEALSKTEKTTQEQPSHSPSLGYYYAFLFDETTGKTYMPKDE